MGDCDFESPDRDGHHYADDDPLLSEQDLAEADEINQIVDEILKQRYPDGPDDDVDWGSLYAEAYELQAERAAVGTPCPKCGRPLPVDLLCDCETWREPPGDDEETF